MSASLPVSAQKESENIDVLCPLLLGIYIIPGRLLSS
jgi:hypothetical protein